ncbi:Putative carboxylesterase, type B, alpha/Beta hydrolase [Septoria linicola]|uniref:Carboxylesterase, type B, alpha/Beta hydrolase n=1 Tax=Septoria linicola TaxID=215465 RepID=A0A9Q9EQK2_9PEZI|nr:Putative carboxylesterase, type B, alpha/Beta hydrolase [Septoria linicola]
MSAQELYDRFAELAGCAGQGSLKCLKGADVQVLREASLAVSALHTYTTSSNSWAPVIDGVFLKEPLSEAAAKGTVDLDVGWSMYNTHEGENFIPPGFQNSTAAGGFNSSEASFSSWLRGFLPGLSKRELSRVAALYPPSGTAEELTYNTTYVRAGLIYRDTVLTCPALWMANSSRQDAYFGQYTIDPAKHASDTVYWNQVNTIQKTNLFIYEGFAGAFASFFKTGDPNAYKLTNSSQAAVPELNQGGEQWIIGSNGFATGPTDMLQRRCAFWQSVARRVPI